MRFWTMLALPTVAFGADITLQHQGQLLDEMGNPITDTVDLQLSLWTDASSTDDTTHRAFSETFSGQVLEGGYHSVVLGADSLNPLDSSVFSTSDLWVQASVDGICDRTRVFSSLNGGHGDPTNANRVGIRP